MSLGSVRVSDMCRQSKPLISFHSCTQLYFWDCIVCLFLFFYKKKFCIKHTCVSLQWYITLRQFLGRIYQPSGLFILDLPHIFNLLSGSECQTSTNVFITNSTMKGMPSFNHMSRETVSIFLIHFHVLACPQRIDFLLRPLHFWNPVKVAKWVLQSQIRLSVYWRSF